MCSNLIGLIVANLTNPFFSEMVQAASVRSDELGYELIVYPVENQPRNLLRALDTFRNNGAQGAMALVSFSLSEEVANKSSKNFPIIMLNGHSQVSTVKNLIIPLWTAGEMAADHLIGIGRHSLAIIHNNNDIDDRFTAFIEHASELGWPVHPLLRQQEEPTTIGGFQATVELLNSAQPFDAIFAYNDLMAIGAMEALHERGIEIPYQCAVLGCDDIPLSSLVRPPLSTITLNPALIGVQAVNRLHEWLQKDLPAPSFQTAKPRLIIRESTDTGLAEISKRLPALGRLTGAIVHDFNNSLAVALGFLELIEMEHADETMLALATSATNTLLRCQVLVRQLTNMFSKPQSPRATLASEYLKETTTELNLAISNTHEVIYQASESAAYLMIDPPMIESALLNLALNASEASTSGQIIITDKPAVVLPTELVSRQNHEFWIIEVTDNGPGIPEAYRPFVFDPFFTKKEGGSGLGLALVRSIISFTGGHIELADSDTGASFRIYLPITDMPPAVKNQPPRPEPSPLPTIALVEDDPNLRQILSRLLERLGCEVKIFLSGDSLLAAIENGLSFDVLVTDLLMPGRSGASTARQIRKLDSKRPIVYLTGAVRPFENKLISDEFSTLILKPIRANDLTVVLELYQRYLQATETTTKD